MNHPDSNGGLPGLEDYLLLTAVVLLPFAFGGVDIGSYRIASFLIVLAAGVAVWKRGWLGLGLNRQSLWLTPAFLLPIWAGLQLVPLPPGAVQVLSPEAHRIYSEAFPTYPDRPGADVLAALEAEALAALPEAEDRPLPDGPDERLGVTLPECLSETWRPLSVQPGATLERLLWYIALLLAFLLARERVTHREVFRLYRATLFTFFAAMALVGLIQAQLWNGRILWFRRVMVVAKPFGPYFNPTNFAAVMELAVPALAGFAWSRVRRAGRSALYEAGFGVAAIAAGVCLVAGVAAASKFAALLIFGGLFALGVFGVRNARARWLLVGATLVLALAGAGLLSSTRLGERTTTFLARTQAGHLLEGRMAVWQASTEMVRDFPVTGAGFGTFRELFPRYLPAGAPLRWSRAHNDYLEVLLDGGVIALGLVIWLALAYWRRAVRALRRSRPISLGRLGWVLGAASLTIHAAVDFNHQIPGNALLFVFVCALALASSSSNESGKAGEGGV